MLSQLYYNATVITVDKLKRIILDGALLVKDGRIAAVGKTLELQRDLPDDVLQVDLDQRIVIPGLINSHVHLIQSIMRGLCEDLELHEWASCAIWPLEVSFRADDGAVAAKLAVAEMMKTGTTCFLEPMLPSSPDNEFSRIVDAVGQSGIRACLGKLVKVPRSDPSAGIRDDRDGNAGQMTIEAAKLAHEQYHGSYNDRVSVWMASETPRGQDEAGFQAVGTACKDHNIRLTVHCAEAPDDCHLIAKHYKASPAEFLRNVNSTGPHVVIGHMVHLAEQDFGILRETGTSVAHNPTSNAKLADGIAPIQRMLEEGINVCLGTDGAPCNNGHDLFRDMHLAGILHKAVNTNSKALPAEQVLEMATINAAKALGLEKEIGSLETGKKADFVVLNHDGLHAAPYSPSESAKGGMPPSTLVVHSLSGRDVDIVVIDGEVVVRAGQLVTMDEEKVKRDARTAIAGMRARANVNAQKMARGWHYE
ncbi:hypothetical protein PFICI_03891 [Pestalotiopsis fici W106-1]|uniref:Amidohydrolase-related domain-containing protein n=1 Tax=Pestalotiopsis fici (strain W106-1 / CGMCC3.15140) TaxID=1229662 RepID=W3XKV8_PESFW|nr:uncharacterized protein PFICI_03891 [Pestalotiopsis fici W106-1]ETS85866.1 hypothetical protein PFICI_03891 [Pestalotiopsis fici W106-1]